MNPIDPTYPAPIDIARAMERGRQERAKAFLAGLSAIRQWISGGRPQTAPKGALRFG